MWVGNNWAGTATIVDARKLEVLQRGVNLIPDKEQELADIRSDPQRLAFYLADPAGRGRGARPVRRRHVHHHRRPLPRGLASELRRRGVGGRRQGDRRALGQHRPRAADGRLPHRPHGSLARRPAAGRQRLDRAPGDRVLHGRRDRGRQGHRDGRPAAHLRVRRDAAREQLQRGRFADLPREHRQGLHARGLPRRRAGEDRAAARRAQGRPLVPDRAATPTSRSPSAGTWARSWPRPATPT